MKKVQKGQFNTLKFTLDKYPEKTSLTIPLQIPLL